MFEYISGLVLQVHVYGSQVGVEEVGLMYGWALGLVGIPTGCIIANPKPSGFLKK